MKIIPARVKNKGLIFLKVNRFSKLWQSFFCCNYEYF